MSPPKIPIWKLSLKASEILPFIKNVPATDIIVSGFSVLGVTVGNYISGTVIPAGTTVEDVFKNMLIKIIPPTYYPPTISLAGGASVESGTTVTPTLTPTYHQNDGGAAGNYTLLKGGVSVYTNATPNAFTDSAFVVGDGVTASYQCNCDYAQGAIKDDNAGNPYPTGRIEAGNVVSNTVSYSGFRYMFYDVSNDGLTSADIRSLTHKIATPYNGITFTINIPVGATNVVFAYPATVRDLTSVKYVEGLNAEVKDIFTQTLVDVEGADGYTAISYKVYKYTPAEPFGATATYNVTL